MLLLKTIRQSSKYALILATSWQLSKRTEDQQSLKSSSTFPNASLKLYKHETILYLGENPHLLKMLISHGQSLIVDISGTCQNRQIVQNHRCTYRGTIIILCTLEIHDGKQLKSIRDLCSVRANLRFDFQLSIQTELQN